MQGACKRKREEHSACTEEAAWKLKANISQDGPSLGMAGSARLVISSEGTAALRTASLSCKVDAIAERLAAAKPVTWKGRGELPQFSFGKQLTPGLLLVLDFWSGLAGTVISLLSLGVRVVVLSCESEPHLREAVAT